MGAIIQGAGTSELRWDAQGLVIRLPRQVFGRLWDTLVARLTAVWQSGAAGAGFAVGELSDAVWTSLMARKNLGTFGDAGAIITDRDDIVERIRAMRNHGSAVRSQHRMMGYNSRLDDLHAAMLSVKLKKIDGWNDRRRQIAALYTAGLQDTGLKLPTEKPGYRHVYHLYVIETERRDEMLQYLNQAGIDAKTHYPIAIHRQAGFPWGFPADTNVSLPLTEKSAASVISLPMFPELTRDEIDYVIDTVREAVK
jgi:dTDP-4-amino-4,6-dideoxygalactose transaminase